MNHASADQPNGTVDGPGQLSTHNAMNDRMNARRDNVECCDRAGKLASVVTEYKLKTYMTEGRPLLLLLRRRRQTTLSMTILIVVVVVVVVNEDCRCLA